MISFLNPLFLLGLAGISVPILIHLLSKKKPRKIYFGDLRFLEIATRRAVKKFRIRQYLLLLLRCLMIILASLIFARPVVHYTPSQENFETVFLLDNSYSMGYFSDGKTRLDAAKDAAKKIIKLLSPRERITVFSFSDSIVPLVKNSTTDREIVLSEIEKIKTDYRKTDAICAINGLIKYFSGNDAKRRVILITDFSKNGWQKKDCALKENYYIIGVDVGDNNAENFAVSNIETRFNDAVLYAANYSVRRKKISSSLYLDGNKSKSLFFEPPAGRESSVSFTFSNIASGIHKCVVETEPDKLPADNRRFFAFYFTDKPKVLLVDGNPQFSDFKGEIYFLKTAMADYADLKTINYAQLENERLEGYNSIFLCNVSNYSRDAAIKLNDTASSGKSVVFFIGDNVTAEKYNSDLNFLLPCDLSSKVAGVGISEFGLSEGKDLLNDINVVKRFLLSPKPGSEPLLKFTDNAPLLIKGRNNVFVFAVSSNLAYSNIPVKPVFPVILKQLFGYIKRDDIKIVSVDIGEKYALPAGISVREMIAPDNKSVRSPPEIQPEEPGIYELKLSNRRTEYLNANVDVSSGESDLTKTAPADIKKYLSKSFIGMVYFDADFDRNIKKVLYGNETTKMLVWLLLAAFLLETWVANPRTK